MRLAARCILASALVATSGAANAAITWDWSFSDGSGDAGSGTLVTNSLSSGSYLLTSISGTWDGKTITGLDPVGSYPFVPSNDNLLLSGSPQLDFSGLYFGVKGSTGENIFFETTQQGAKTTSYYVEADNSLIGTAGKFTATQAPEMDPLSAASGLALLVGGLLVSFGRRRPQGLAV